MKRFISTLTEVVLTLPTLFQATEPARVGHVALQASHEPNTVEKKFSQPSLEEIPANLPANALIPALSLLVALNSVQTAKAQNLNAGRERSLRECMLSETRVRPDSEERGKTGSRDLRYKACMTQHGEIE